MGKTKKRRKTISNAVLKNNEDISNLNGFEEIDTQANTRELLLKEFSVLSKSNLVLGTNAVLRLLEKSGLVVVFTFSHLACPAVYHSLSSWCKWTGAEFIPLKEKDNSRWRPKFPKAVTYGIQKEAIETMPEIAYLLDKLKAFRKPKKQDDQIRPATIDTEETISPSDEPNQTYYHGKHPVVHKLIDEFIPISSFSKPKIDFPTYDTNHQAIDVRIK